MADATSLSSAAAARAQEALERFAAKPKRKIPPYATLLSGGASGLASCLLLQPLDLLKTRMQQAPDVAASRVREGRTARLLRTARTVVSTEGVQGLWRGTGPTVVRNVPGVALYFYSVTELRRVFSTSSIPLLSLPARPVLAERAGQSSTMAELTTLGNVVTGAVARTAIGFVLCPVTVVKARFESSHFAPQAYSSISSALRHIYVTDGVRGLFQGFSATALRDAPYAGMYMASYEGAKAWLGRSRGTGDPGVVVLSGLMAGTLATLATHPFDILKTRLQTNPHHGRASGPTKALSLLATARQVWQTEGSGVFLDGLGLRCARKAASSAIGWGIFEAGRGAWARREEARRRE